MGEWFKSSNPKLKGRVFETAAERDAAEKRLAEVGGETVDYATEKDVQRRGETPAQFAARKKKAEAARIAKKEGQKKALK